MAYLVLQGSKNVVASGNGTCAFTTSNLSAGTKILCLVAVDFSTGGNPVTSVKDAAGNTLTLLADLTYGSTTGFTGLYAMDTPAADAGIKPTLTATVTTNFGVAMIVAEVAGLLAGNTTAMCDGTGTSASGTASPATGGTGYTTAAAGELLVFGYGDPGFSAEVYSPLTGFQFIGVESGNSTANAVMAYMASTGALESASMTITPGTAMTWGTVLIAFKLAAVPITLSGALGWAVNGVAYSETITAAGGTGPYTYAVTSGSLPGWATLSTGGVLSGTPSAVAAAGGVHGHGHRLG